VLNNIDELYELFPEKDGLTADELRVYMLKKSPSRDMTHVNAIVTSALNQDIGPEITNTLLETVIERHMAAKIMAVCSPIVSNQKTGGLVQLEDVMGEYREMVTLLDRPDVLNDCDFTFQQAIEYTADDSGLRWPIAILNQCLGGAKPGLGLVIARPDTGKTSFILNCLAFFAYQLRGTDRQLLYCGNEEDIVNLKARTGVSLLGVEHDWAEKNAKAFGEQIGLKNGNCIRFHGGIRSTRDVETLIKRYEPVVTVLDQLPKFILPGNTAEGPAGLANVFGWFRDKAQVLSTMMLGVAQADVKSGIWVNMNNINGSKTDVPGELDWGVGVGFDDEAGMEMVRFVNVFKNKGRKGRAQVAFDPERCRYTG
jgi:hypothetical protein